MEGQTEAWDFLSGRECRGQRGDAALGIATEIDADDGRLGLSTEVDNFKCLGKGIAAVDGQDHGRPQPSIPGFKGFDGVQDGLDVRRLGEGPGRRLHRPRRGTELEIDHSIVGKIPQYREGGVGDGPGIVNETIYVGREERKEPDHTRLSSRIYCRTDEARKGRAKTG